MSSVSSVSGGQGLSQLLQQLIAQSQQGQTSAVAPPTAGQDSDGDNDGSSSPASFATSLNQNSFVAQLESTITSALNSAGSLSDPNQVVQGAITQLLTGGSTQNSAGSATNEPTSQQSSLSQLLTSYGVNGDQFQQNLQAALQNSANTGGPVDFATVFQNLPPGSAVNVLA